MTDSYGYKKTTTVQIQRTKHSVCFGEGFSVGSVIEMLQHVPAAATVDECYTDDSGIHIVFHEESRVQ